jgi:type II secretory pathway component PulC
MTNLTFNILIFIRRRLNEIIIFIYSLLIIILVTTLAYQLHEIIADLRENFVSNHITNHHAIISAIPLSKISISKYHIFGEQAAISQAKTNIKWTLRGIIIGNNPTKNFAIIASSDTDEAIYKQGDKLLDDAKVLNILPDKVLLSRDDEVEILVMPWDTESALVSSPNPIVAPTEIGDKFTLEQEP